MGLHHGHSHAHGHGHNHSHGHNQTNRVRVGIAAILTGSFMVAEIIGGLISGSLALLADAGHMLTDFAALTMAWGAFKLAQRPANRKMTFGYDRFSILVAFVNGLTLILIAAWIIVEAIQRFQSPGEILAGPMLWVAIGGLIVNIVVFWILMGADQENLNVKGAVLHVMGDLLGSLAAVTAALIIMKTGWVPIDPILSVLVALLILRSAWYLVKQSAHILLEGAPPHIDRRAIRDDLMAHIPELIDIHHIHTWCITPERPMLTLEATTQSDASLEPINRAIKKRLKSEFHIAHATVDVMRDTSSSPTSPCDLHNDG